MRVLVVDDSVLIREAARLGLQQTGDWEVLTAESGEEALRSAAHERPDAILLDVVMPGLDGIATAERLASSPATASIPIVLLTAKDDTGQFARLPVRGVIAKPFDLPALAGQVADVLGW
jgi:two-component system alkaline phosphatase synthesis response regulator PhoP